jgi:outer membrane lipoprotein-sorting protein
MRKILLLLTLLLGLIALGTGQKNKAREILDEVSKRTQACSSISATFTYSMMNEEENVRESYSGSILLKGDKYLVTISDIPVRMVSDGTTIWSYMEDVNEVTVSRVEDQTSELTDPAKVFRIYEEGFAYEFKGEKQTSDGKTLYRIDLIPETEAYDFSRISIAIDQATMLIASATMTDEMGTQYTIATKKVELNKPVEDSVFTFDVSEYEDIEIIDFR